MPKPATLTVRVDEELRRLLEQRAAREHRSLSAQIEHELSRALRDEEAARPAATGSFLGRFSGTASPEESDFAEARRRLWGRLSPEA